MCPWKLLLFRKMIFLLVLKIKTQFTKDGFKETICRSYNCSPLLRTFLCVTNAELCWGLDKLSQSFFDIFHNSFTWHKIIKIFHWNCLRFLINIYKSIHHSNNTTWSQTLIIAQTLKALHFLLNKSVLTLLFFTHKKRLRRGKHS